MCGTCGCKSAETLSKTSCCCGADEANPCACMKAPEPMECSAKAPKCACYKALEKNAEFLYYYVLNEKGESPADFNTLEEAQTYVANSSEPLEIYERRSRDDEAYKMDKKMNAESLDDMKIKYGNRDRIFFIKSVDYDTDGEIENDELPQEFTIKIPSDYHYFDEDADERDITDVLNEWISTETGFSTKGIVWIEEENNSWRKNAEYDEEDMVSCNHCWNVIGNEKEVYGDKTVEYEMANDELVCVPCHKIWMKEYKNDLDPHYSPFYAESFEAPNQSITTNKIGESLAWNNRIMGMGNQWRNGKYDINSISQEADIIGYTIVHEDYLEKKLDWMEDGVNLGSKDTDIAEINFAGMKIYTGGDGSFPVMGMYENINDYYARTQNKPHPRGNMTMMEFFDREDYEKAKYEEAKWEYEFIEWVRETYQVAPTYFDDGSEMPLYHHVAEKIGQENIPKLLVGARLSLHNPTIPTLKRRDSKSSIWVLKIPDLTRLKTTKYNRNYRGKTEMFLNTETTTLKFFSNLKAIYPKGRFVQGTRNQKYKEFTIDIPSFGEYKWVATEYMLAYDSVSQSESLRREGVKRQKYLKEDKIRQEEKMKALKEKYGAETFNAQEEEYFVFADGTTELVAEGEGEILTWRMPYSEIRDYVNEWTDDLWDWVPDQDWRLNPYDVAYNFAYDKWEDEPYGMNWAENIRDAVNSRIWMLSDNYNDVVDLDDKMTKAEIRSFLTGIPSWRKEIAKRAENFSATVIRQGNAPKGAMAKAMMNKAMMEQANIEAMIQELENKVNLGLINEDELMKSLKKKFGAEYDIEELSKEDLEAYFADLKKDNPKLAKILEFNVKNEEYLPKMLIESSGYDYEILEAWNDSIIDDDKYALFDPCKACEGEGWIMTSYTPATRWDPADGDGEDCGECGGSGKIDPSDYMYYDDKGDIQYEAETKISKTCPNCEKYGRDATTDYICDFCAQCKRCCETSYGCYDVAICNDCDGSFIGKDIDGCCGSCDNCCECGDY